MVNLCFYVFVPCIVIQLCNVNQKMHIFKLMFYFNSSCLLHVSNILCSSSGMSYFTCSFIWRVFHAFIQAVWQVAVCAVTHTATNKN